MQFLPMADQEAPGQKQVFREGEVVELHMSVEDEQTQEVCCGGPPPPRSSPFEQPGYELKHYVSAFLKSCFGDVPLVKTELDYRDHLGSLKARIGIGRDDYKVAPGLYGLGSPDSKCPVIVTANYKLTFDMVRKELDGLDCWLLVLDTCGINVWCAAGKQTFSTNEIVRQVELTRLADRVGHRNLIVPQLGATGVAAHEVKPKCGFRVSYGPVQIRHLKEFLRNGRRATTEMRAVSFTLRERFVLIPVEFYLFGKKIWWILPVLFILSGIGPSFFSVTQAIERGVQSCFAVVFGGVLGAIAVPLLLPWIPGRSFSFKGFVVGLAGSLGGLAFLAMNSLVDGIAFVSVVTAVSSYLAMNFTGSTPFTSPSGVEKEMRIAIPLQAAALAAGALLWLAGSFF